MSARSFIIILNFVFFTNIAFGDSTPAIENSKSRVKFNPPIKKLEEISNLFELIDRIREPGFYEKFKSEFAKLKTIEDLKSGDEDLLTYALRRRMTVSAQSEIRSDRNDLVDLISTKTKNFCPNSYLGNPLHHTMAKDDLNLFLFFLDKGCELSAKNGQGLSVLENSMPYSPEILRYLLIEPKYKSYFPQAELNNLLSKANWFSSPRFIKILLSFGADPKEIIARAQYNNISKFSMDLFNNFKTTKEAVELKNKKVIIPKYPPQKSNELIEAVNNNDPEKVKLLLSKGLDPNSISAMEFNKNYNMLMGSPGTALHIALKKKFYPIAKLLIESGADLNIHTPIGNDNSNGGELPLQLVLNDYEMTEYLLKKGADANAINLLNGNNLVHFATNIKTLELLLKYKIDINQVGFQGNALRYIFDEQIDILNWLINHKIDINHIGFDGNSAIHNSIINNQIEVVKTLINNHVDLNLKNEQKLNALELAKSIGNEKIANLIANGGGLVKDQKSLFETSLYVCNEKTLTELVQANFDLKIETSYPYILVLNHCVDRAMKSRLIKLFVQKGADINCADTNKRSLLHYSTEMADVETVKTLIDLKANVNLQTDQLRSPLHIAASGPQDHRPADGPNADFEIEGPKFLEIAKILMKAGANPNLRARDYEGTPIEIAQKIKNEKFKIEMLKILTH